MSKWNRSKAVCFMAVGVVAGAFTLFGCGGGAEAPAQVATSDLTVPITTTTVQALEGLPFTFPSGAALAPALATQPVTLTFTNTAAPAPTFTVTAPTVVGTDGQPARATGTTQFGSCTFTVLSSTFPSSTSFPGGTITIDPCSVQVSTQGLQATGLPIRTGIKFITNQSISGTVFGSVSINPNGTVVFNSTLLGTLTLQVVTGASGG